MQVDNSDDTITRADTLRCTNRSGVSYPVHSNENILKHSNFILSSPPPSYDEVAHSKNLKLVIEYENECNGETTCKSMLPTYEEYVSMGAII